MKSLKIRGLCSSLIMFSSIMLGSINAYATDGIACNGTIGIIGLHSPNAVILKLSSMNTQVQVCNLASTVGVNNPIPAEQCKAIYSTLLAAYSMSKSVTVMFDNVQTGTSCSNFQGWELATSRWVALTN